MLRVAGLIAFYTIFIPPGLPSAAHERALVAAPRFVASHPQMQQELLQRAGFAGVSEIDVTAEFLRVSQAWTRTRQKYSAQLRDSEGDAEFTRRQTEGRATAAAIKKGFLRRSLFLAHRP